MRSTTRREFLHQAVAGGAAALLFPSLGGLVRSLVPPELRRIGVPRGPGDYGPLFPAGPELALPEGFAYRVIAREGALMTNGAPTPRAHDGMAAFGRPDGPGSTGPSAATGTFYRFIPHEPGRLVEGGELQMLAVAGAEAYDARIGQRVGARFPVRWVPIRDPDPTGAATDPLAVPRQGWALGAATFGRLEGAWWGDGGAYFIDTSSGDAGYGQVWHYRPAAGDAAARKVEEAGELTLVYESPGAALLAHPDNVTVSPRGGILLCEDPDDAPVHLRGLTPQGEVFDFARNLLNAREFAGACFSPDGRVLFVNLQGDTAVGGPGDPGMTFAIWGPWERGAL